MRPVRCAAPQGIGLDRRQPAQDPGGQQTDRRDCRNDQTPGHPRRHQRPCPKLHHRHADKQPVPRIGPGGGDQRADGHDRNQHNHRAEPLARAIGKETVIEHREAMRWGRRLPGVRAGHRLARRDGMGVYPPLLGLPRPVASAERLGGQREDGITGVGGGPNEPGRDHHRDGQYRRANVPQKPRPPGAIDKHHRQHRHRHQRERKILHRAGPADHKGRAEGRAPILFTNPLPQPKHGQRHVAQHRQVHHAQPAQVEHERAGGQHDRGQTPADVVFIFQGAEHAHDGQRRKGPVQQLGKVHPLVRPCPHCHCQQEQHFHRERMVAVTVVLQLPYALGVVVLTRYLEVLLELLLGVAQPGPERRTVGGAGQPHARRHGDYHPDKDPAVEPGAEAPFFHPVSPLPGGQQHAKSDHGPPQPRLKQTADGRACRKHQHGQQPQTKRAGGDRAKGRGRPVRGELSYNQVSESPGGDEDGPGGHALDQHQQQHSQERAAGADHNRQHERAGSQDDRNRCSAR